MNFIIAPAPTTSLAITGTDQRFPIRRVYCVGRNYVEHAVEMGFTGREPPFFFMKPADAVVPAAMGDSLTIDYPALTKNYHHEVELVVAIDRGGKNIRAAEAHKHIFGYAVGLDMTRRDLQGECKKQGRPWEIGKAVDQSAPIGAITPKSACGELISGEIVLTVNGKTTQKSDINKLIWTINEVIEHLSAAWELQPGDIIMTGTPEGVAAVVSGDVMVATCAGLDSLTVHIN
ncbi:MAG: FAA hydrolase family protein [Burkholderiales bacterium]|nr:MAG: FAA hydrolase family protein [Betaproteobacteria bacterium]TAG29023.1 MAG: FAA hydrolase family protein [Burkholderiales bacterium]